MLKSFCTKDLIYRRKEHKMCSNPIVLYLTTLHTQYSLPAIVIYYAPAVKCYCLFLNKQINLVITYFLIPSIPVFLSFSVNFHRIYCKSHKKTSGQPLNKFILRSPEPIKHIISSNLYVMVNIAIRRHAASLFFNEIFW